MKSCPKCNRTYSDETLTFCLNDGALLSAPYDPQATLVMPTFQGADLPIKVPSVRKKSLALPIIIAGLLIAGAIFAAIFFSRSSQSNQNRPPENPTNASTSNANAFTSSKSLKVQIKAIGETVWLKSRIDDEVAMETRIAANEVKEFAFDNSLRIQYAKIKASVIDISINGRKAKIPNNYNAPLYEAFAEMVITKENYTQFLVE